MTFYDSWWLSTTFDDFPRLLMTFHNSWWLSTTFDDFPRLLRQCLYFNFSSLCMVINHALLFFSQTSSSPELINFERVEFTTEMFWSQQVFITNEFLSFLCTHARACMVNLQHSHTALHVQCSKRELPLELCYGICTYTHVHCQPLPASFFVSSPWTAQFVEFFFSMQPPSFLPQMT